MRRPTDRLLAQATGVRNDEEIYDYDDAVLQVTDAHANGDVEIAFDEPRSNRRHYLTFNVSELVSLAMAQPKSEN